MSFKYDSLEGKTMFEELFDRNASTDCQREDNVKDDTLMNLIPGAPSLTQLDTAMKMINKASLQLMVLASILHRFENCVIT